MDPFSELVGSKDNSMALREYNFLMIEVELERLIQLKKKKDNPVSKKKKKNRKRKVTAGGDDWDKESATSCYTIAMS